MTITTSRHEGEEFADLTIRWSNNTSLIIGASYDKQTVTSTSYGADLATKIELTSTFVGLLKDHSTVEALDGVAKQVGGMVLTRRAQAKVKAVRCDGAHREMRVAVDAIELTPELLDALS